MNFERTIVLIKDHLRKVNNPDQSVNRNEVTRLAKDIAKEIHSQYAHNKTAITTLEEKIREAFKMPKNLKNAMAIYTRALEYLNNAYETQVHGDKLDERPQGSWGKMSP